MPSPQTLVAFVSGLFVLLLATRVQLGFDPYLATGSAVLLALGGAFIVERRIPDLDEEVDEDEPVADGSGDE